MCLFGLLVAFLGGVITGAMLIFFARGPLVAYFRVADEPDHEPAPVTSAEILGPARVSPRRRSGRPARWQRVSPGRHGARLAAQRGPEVIEGAPVVRSQRRLPPWDRVSGDTDFHGGGA